MNQNEIFEKVKELMLLRIPVAPESVTPDALLKEDLEVDSLDLVELSMMLEDEFSIKIPDDRMAEIKTVGDVVEFIQTGLSVLD
jgi:acyl carrier protein